MCLCQGGDGDGKISSSFLRVEFGVAFGLSRRFEHTPTVRAGASGFFVDERRL
jgi:hypothetical protein